MRVFCPAVDPRIISILDSSRAILALTFAAPPAVGVTIEVVSPDAPAIVIPSSSAAEIVTEPSLIDPAEIKTSFQRASAAPKE